MNALITVQEIHKTPAEKRHGCHDSWIVNRVDVLVETGGNYRETELVVPFAEYAEGDQFIAEHRDGVLLNWKRKTVAGEV